MTSVAELDRTAKRYQDAAKPVPRLRYNLATSMLGTLVYTASQWLMLIAIARLSDPQALGRFSLALALSGPAFVFCNMQLRTFQASDVQRRFSTATYFRTRTWTSLVAIASVALVYLFVYRDETFWPVLAILVIAKTVESFSDVCYGRFQLAQQMQRIAVSQALRGVVQLILFAILLWQTQSLAYGLLGVLLTWVVVLFAYDLPQVNRLNRADTPLTSTGRGTPWQLIALCLPAAPAAICIALEPNLPRYFLASETGLAELGHYTAMSQVAIALQLFAVSLFHVLVPKLAQAKAEHNDALTDRLIQHACLAGAGCGLCLTVLSGWFGSFFLTWLYGAAYAQETISFTLLVAATSLSFVWLPLAAKLQADQQLWHRLWIHASSLLTLFIACVFLVPTQGVYGAAIATFLGTVTQFLAYVTVHLVRCRTHTASTACEHVHHHRNEPQLAFAAPTKEVIHDHT